MDTSHSNDINKTLTLEQAAQTLSVSIDTLLQWNELNILKPTIVQEGVLVYSQEQIDKFIEIQRAILGTKTGSDIRYTPFPTSVSKPQKSAESDGGNHFLRWLTLSFSGIVLAVLVGRLLTGHNQLISPIKTAGQDDSNTVAQASGPPISMPPPLLVQPENKTSSTDTNLIAAPKNKDQGIHFANSHVNQPSNAASVDGMNSASDTVGYSQIASGNKSGDIFDDSGNIKGETTSTDVLGLTLGITKMMQSDNPVNPNTTPSLLFTFVILSSVSIFFIMRKQFAHSLSSDMLAMSPNFSYTHDQKIIEIDQKMDGTVVLYFQDKEYKICKPELDSESDQLIERLMELSNPDTKEIDYDRSTDENLRLNTPLSKLVTRLGFIGIKRTLFFPRTSKNKVRFRRYVTKEDLMAMNLNTHIVSKDFLQI